jgi:2-isopropylmalate synthase
VTEGIDALGEVTVRVRSLSERDTKNAQHEAPSAPVFHGNAADTDIIVASAKAYLKALNRVRVAFDSARPSGDRITPHAPLRAVEGGRP